LDFSILSNLFEVLEKEAEIYQNLEKISGSKTNIIVEGKVSELENLVRLEQSLVVQIGKLEDIREELVSQLASQLQVGPSELTISELANHVEDVQAQKLRTYQDKMANIIGSLKNSNELNSKLIKNSLEYIDFSINLVAAAGTADNNYGNSGEVSNSKKRSFFDKRL